MDIGQLIKEMYALYAQAQAQLQHKDHLLQSQRGWEAMQVGLRDTEELLRRGASEIGPEWQDEAGDLYAQRLQRSSVTVQAWQQTLASANIGPTLTTLAQGIDTTFDGVSQLKQQFDALVAQLADGARRPDGGRPGGGDHRAAAGPGRAGGPAAAAARPGVRGSAQRISGAASGTPWDGPQGAGAAQAATTAAGGGRRGRGRRCRRGGRGGDGRGRGATGRPVEAADPPPLVGRPVSGRRSSRPAVHPGWPASPCLPVSLPPGGLPTIPPVSTPPMPTLPPLVPPVGAIGSGIGGGYQSGRFGAGVPALTGTAGGAIPRAGKAVVGVAPLAAAQPPAPPATTGPGTAGTTTGTGMGRMMPPMMMPPVGGGTGAGNSPKPGTPDNRDAGHRNRPLRAVPGVPPRLRGRSETLAGTPAFLGGPGRPTTRRDKRPGQHRRSCSTRSSGRWSRHRRR